MTALPATLPAMRSPPPPLFHTCAASFHPARSRLSSRLRCSSPGAHFSSLMSTASLCGWAEPGDIYQYGKRLACVCVFARRAFFFFFLRHRPPQAASCKHRNLFLKLTRLLWITKRPLGRRERKSVEIYCLQSLSRFSGKTQRWPGDGHINKLRSDLLWLTSDCLAHPATAEHRFGLCTIFLAAPQA